LEVWTSIIPHLKIAINCKTPASTAFGMVFFRIALAFRSPGKTVPPSDKTRKQHHRFVVPNPESMTVVFERRSSWVAF
jgi:hypothetical protein